MESAKKLSQELESKFPNAKVEYHAGVSKDNAESIFVTLSYGKNIIIRFYKIDNHPETILLFQTAYNNTTVFGSNQDVSELTEVLNFINSKISL